MGNGAKGIPLCGRSRSRVSIPYGKWSRVLSRNFRMESSSFNTLWEMEPWQQMPKAKRRLVSIPYGKWSHTMEVQTVNDCTFQYPMGNGATLHPVKEKNWYIIVSIPYGKWSLIPEERMAGLYSVVSIPYGKWSQQQFVAGAIIADKSLHVKKFL